MQTNSINCTLFSILKGICDANFHEIISKKKKKLEALSCTARHLSTNGFWVCSISLSMQLYLSYNYEYSKFYIFDGLQLMKTYMCLE